MVKIAIKIVGVFFLLSGLLDIINFLWTGTQPTTFIHVDIFGYNIAGFVFVIILLGTGLSIIRFKNSGRIWGLIILWLYSLQIFIALIIFFVYMIKAKTDSSIGTGLPGFHVTAFGLGKDYMISNPWFLFAFFVSGILIGIQIFILSSKKNRTYFTAE